MNQLYEVMQAADVVIGIGARFSLGNPAGESSTLVDINIDDTELTRHQANTIPLHGDARATIEALLPCLIEAGARERPSPAEAVIAARNLIAYYDIRLKEPQYPVLEAMQNGIPEDAFIVWDVTQFRYYARTHYQVNHPKTYIDSGYSFNLGYAFPTALGGCRRALRRDADTTRLPDCVCVQFALDTASGGTDLFLRRQRRLGAGRRPLATGLVARF